ncbi:MAG: futalosine hydrolase [Sphingobacteriales bacterium]|uniref:futalosine hydrolase n=1 Tax=Hydrotalea flava TaxID=714549 RepID=UPI00082EBA4E|nr:futalosine hydrolase [Hydrotalea flava]RTL47762.1 MAG: futalosine hydrolase [Sphingobacteriales bacterium]
MKIWITAATPFEIRMAKETLQNKQYQNIAALHFVTTGVGMLLSAVQLTKLVLTEQPDFIIQAGIAGTFHSNLPSAEIVVVKKEILGDTGVMEQNQWKDMFDLGLISGNIPPFENGCIPNPNLKQWNITALPEVSGISVNEISTQPQYIAQMNSKYAPDIETMEGAALHYVAGTFNIPYLQIRAISNIVGERDKQKWAIQEALETLNKSLIHYIEALDK